MCASSKGRAFQLMYDGNEEMFIEAGVAKKLDKPVHMDREGNEVDESSALGRPVTDFTAMCWTDGNGAPVMFCIIFAAEKMEALWELGFDLFAEFDEGGGIDANSGPGKAFPGGPTITYRGVEVPCFCDCSPSGSMTSLILMRMLEQMDALGLFPRYQGGPRPCALTDGHITRLEPPYLNYVNHRLHVWFAGIGVPYGTSKWQLGDSRILCPSGQEQEGTCRSGMEPP